MRKLIITGMAVAMLALPAAASANVAVDNGVGYVGKGDVQNALSLKNDTALQTLFKSQPNGAAIEFTANVDRVIADYEMTCGPANTGATMHKIITQPATMVVKATADTNNAGKVNGWNLTGELGKAISVGQATLTETACPEGSFAWMPVKTTQYVKGITGDLKVNGFALPNTPAPVVEPVL